MALENVNHGLSGIAYDRIPVTVNDDVDNTGGKQAKARVYFAKDQSKGIEITLLEPHGSAGNQYRIVPKTESVTANAVDVDTVKMEVKIDIRLIGGTGAAQIKGLIDANDELSSAYFGSTAANDNLHQFTLDDFSPSETHAFEGGEDTPCFEIRITTAGALTFRTIGSGTTNRTETFTAGEYVPGRFTRILSTGTVAGARTGIIALVTDG